MGQKKKKLEHFSVGFKYMTNLFPYIVDKILSSGLYLVTNSLYNMLIKKGKFKFILMKYIKTFIYIYIYSINI